MTWVKLTDDFPHHPKVAALSDAEFRGHVTGLCYAGRYNTDGVLHSAALDSFGVRFDPERLTVQLPGYSAPLWVPSDMGWSIHDFLIYNPSRERITARKASDRRRKDPLVEPTAFPTPCQHGEPRGALRCALCRHEREDTA